jgi:hypothetical protein
MKSIPERLNPVIVKAIILAANARLNLNLNVVDDQWSHECSDIYEDNPAAPIRMESQEFLPFIETAYGITHSSEMPTNGTYMSPYHDGISVLYGYLFADNRWQLVINGETFP